VSIHSPATQIELEIQRLLKTDSSVESIVHQLVHNYANSTLSREELQSISIFFLYAGHYATLTDFLVKALGRGLPIPWAHFSEALFLSSPAIPEAIKASVVRGADSQNQMEELARSVMLDHFDDRLSVLRQKRTKLHQDTHEKKKGDLIATLEMLQAQGLVEEEQRLLGKIRRHYPNDPEIEKLNRTHLKQRTRELLQEVKGNTKSWIPLLAYQKPNAEMAEVLQLIENAQKEALQKSDSDPNLAYNFAVAHIMWENYSSALEFSNHALSGKETLPISIQNSVRWLRLEILFELRRFIDVLSELDSLEVAWVGDPHATFGILYLRAQVLWELNQRQQAVDIMDSIVSAKPHFRNCRSLLAEWKGEAI
jgi:tetratricopeptide (TPR) repeat protein